MRTRFAFLSALFLLFVGQVVFAQVTGTVQDGDGFPLPDAEVTVRGSNVSTITDEDGAFSIDAQIGSVLVVTDVMGTSQDYNVVRSNMGVLKFGEAIEIGEVVILGYDKTTTRKESMGAQTTISEETFENRATSSFLNSLQGHAPGVVIQSNSGSPGSSQIDVLIRGRGSINASTDPLIVVDGIVIGSAQFRNLNQQDFESVSVLRDAHATSIYGNRGANGVIVIKTKSGRFGTPLSIEFSSMYGVMTLPDNDYNMSNAKQLLTLQKRRNSGFGSTLTDEEIENWDGPDSDWSDVLFKSGISQQYNLALRQGSENFRSYFSLGYNDVSGMIPTTDFKRFNVRANLNGNTSNKRLDYESNISLSYSKRHQLDSETNTNISNNVVQNPLFGSVLGMPYLDPYLYNNGKELYYGNENGPGIQANSSGPGNWAYILKDILVPGQLPNEFTEKSILANIGGGYKLTDDLTFRTKVGLDYKNQTRNFARAPWSYLAIVVAKTSSPELAYPGFETFSTTEDATISSVSSFLYDKSFGDHNLKLGAYAEYVKAHYRFKSLRQNGLVESTWVFGSGSGWAVRDGDLYVPQISGNRIDAGTFSYFGTLDYEYARKYGVGGTIRRDATSKFLGDKKWGTFWSAAGRWVISEEEFLSGSQNINMLKLRGSYGVTGNQILSQPGYDTNPLFLDTDIAYDYYSSDNTIPGYLNGISYFPTLGNINVGWEETHQANIGLDFILFNNRLDGNIDVYQKTTKELYTSIGLSSVSGEYVIDGNNGELENKGIEVSLRYKIIRSNDFNLTLWANTAYNENKILALDTEMNNIGGPALKEGHEAYEFLMIPYAGVNMENGEFMYYDIDGNRVGVDGIDPERDARWTGKSLLPKWVGGFGLNADYKGLYLDVNFSYQADYYKFDNLLSWLYDSASVNSMNMSADLLDAWSPENPNGSLPSLTANQTLDGQSDRLLFDASFIRLRSATFGYNIPKDLLSNTFVKGMNVFVQGENLLLWTKWRGFDPEGQRNFSLGQYPNPRIISLGINVEF